VKKGGGGEQSESRRWENSSPLNSAGGGKSNWICFEEKETYSKKKEKGRKKGRKLCE